MISPGFTHIQIIDNTVSDDVAFKSHKVEGFHSGQLAPNLGEVIESAKFSPGTKVAFFTYAPPISGKYVLDTDVVISDGRLVAPGILVDRKHVDSYAGKFKFREQDFFRVIQSTNIDTIGLGSFVVTQRSSSYRINQINRATYYVSFKNILLVFDGHGAKAGPDYLLLDAIPKYEETIFKYSDEMLDDRGRDEDGIVTIFRQPALQVEIEDRWRFIVHRKDLIGAALP